MSFGSWKAYLNGLADELEAALAFNNQPIGMKPESLDAIREMERIDRAELEKGEA